MKPKNSKPQTIPDQGRQVVLGPFNRVEGDLEVHLSINNQQITQARVNAPMFRGFETMLTDKPLHDALFIVPRICGICSVAQSVAAAQALAHLAAITPPRNGQIITHLLLATENLADHLTHFYLFFMPDFTRECYASQAWYPQVVARMAAQSGQGTQRAIQARFRWFQILGLLGGKWPHTQAIEPGGTSRALESVERLRLIGWVREFRSFLETEFFSASLEHLLSLSTAQALWNWVDEGQGGDFRLFLQVAKTLHLEQLGQGQGCYMSYGAYPRSDGSWLLPSGVWIKGYWEILKQESITEDPMFARYDGHIQHPWHGQTVVHHNKQNAYTWNKAPRYQGHVMETGALARQMVAQTPLIHDLHQHHGGGNVLTRMVARCFELAQGLLQIEEWLHEIKLKEPFCYPTPTTWDVTQGVGMVEAARGSLGHWVVQSSGIIQRYQIIAPTSWNFSPRDQQGQAGVLEQALEGLWVAEGDLNPVQVQHIVRSFDPCMVCTVH